MTLKRSMQPKYRRRRQLAVALALALTLLLVGISGYVWYQRSVVGQRDYEGAGNGTVVMVKVGEGDSLSSIAPTLVEKKIVGSRRALMREAEARDASLQTGYYPLQEKMSASAALDALTDDANRRGVVDIPTGLTLEDVTVVGGKTREGIYSLISAQTCSSEDECISSDALREAVVSSTPEELEVPQWAKGAVAERTDDPRRIEGLISPGVHLFDPTATPQEIMRELISNSAAEYEATGLLKAADAVGLSAYEMITAASLVEREAPAGAFDKVARVILNRLKEDQRLEFDSTVNYDVAEQEVATTDDDRARRTPWNTYAKKGLPETPIASPGIQALQAMEHPAEGDWLYFVTINKDGETVFNRDFDAHEAAIEKARANGVLDSAR